MEVTFNKHRIDMAKFDKWTWIKPYSLCVGIPPKCGTQTLARWLIQNLFPAWNSPNLGSVRNADHSVVQPLMPLQVRTELPNSVLRLGVIRCPVARFWSLWRNKCRDPLKYGRDYLRGGIPQYLIGASPEQLLDTIEEHPYANTHWAPQEVVLQDLSAVLVRTENLSAWWEKCGYPPLPSPANATADKGERDDSLTPRIEALYPSDLELYNSAS